NSFLDMKYDLDKYANEINLLNKKNDVSQNELEKQKQIRKFTIIALLLFSIMAITSLLFYYHKKKMVEVLNSKKEDLEKSNQLLLESREELNVLNDNKNKIFSVLAHDLINPFNALLGFASLLNEESQHLNKKEVKQYGEIIYQTATNLLYLLENLLQWSKSQTGRIVVNKKNTELKKVLESVLSVIYILADKKQIKINTSFQSNCVAFIDADLVSSALRNIIQNAIKFTYEGNAITISTECTKDETKIIIADTGTGISAEDQGKLFQASRHFSTAGTANEQGTGLGLMITREFIKLNNGKLTLSSEIGKGSTFTIIFPLINPNKDIGNNTSKTNS
ncbi:MAG: HAMP domain-containing histidine kinase, partial [Bacteroidales bacterium]|nr:HAMP domain-containing histidine kinase [Bacteroidales bacterium]